MGRVGPYPHRPAAPLSECPRGEDLDRQGLLPFEHQGCHTTSTGHSSPHCVPCKSRAYWERWNQASRGLWAEPTVRGCPGLPSEGGPEQTGIIAANTAAHRGRVRWSRLSGVGSLSEAWGLASP